MNDSQKEKIQKLLNLSQNNPNENEAKAALLKAQELMIKYQIDSKDLNDVDLNKEKEIVNVDILKGQKKSRIMWYETAMASMISNNFKTFYYMSGYRDTGRHLYFCGIKDDVEITVFAYKYAINAMTKLFKYYCKDMHLESTASRRNDYYKGFIKGLERAFKDQIDKNNWGLMVIKEKLVVDHERQLNIKVVHPSGIRPKRSNNMFDVNRGESDGYSTGSSYKTNNKLKG